MEVNLKRLIAVREERKISQEEMAYILGYKTKGAYNKIEKGIVRLRLEQVQLIVKALELTEYETISIFFAKEVA